MKKMPCATSEGCAQDFGTGPPKLQECPKATELDLICPKALSGRIYSSEMPSCNCNKLYECVQKIGCPWNPRVYGHHHHHHHHHRHRHRHRHRPRHHHRRRSFCCQGTLSLLRSVLLRRSCGSCSNPQIWTPWCQKWPCGFWKCVILWVNAQGSNDHQFWKCLFSDDSWILRIHLLHCGVFDTGVSI